MIGTSFWSQIQIWANYQARPTEVAGWPIEQQLSRAVHGKHFFPEVVHTVLSQWLGQTKASKRQNQLLQNAIPSPIYSPFGKKWYKRAFFFNT